MKRLKRIIAGVLAIMMILSVDTQWVQAEDAVEKPYLGLDPSTIIDSEAEAPYIPQIETYGNQDAIIQMDGSKKGIQGTEWITDASAAELGVKHVLLNMGLTPLIAKGDTDYQYNGKTYRFNANYLKGYQQTVSALNANGITVTVVLLVQDDVGMENWADYVYAPERGHNFYAMNMDSEKSRETWSAAFQFLAEQFGQTNCNIENWILGNEVNTPAAYHWTGTLDATENARIYAKAFVPLYNALQSQNNKNPGKPAAKAYISLDRAWNDNGGGKAIAAKEMLDKFAAQVESIQKNVDWGIAFHPYAVAMDPTSSKFSEAEKLLWGNNPYTPNNINAKFITAANLNVLTDYVKNTYGEQHRIILSEQGFDAKGGEDYQAASLSYTFYAGQFNDMVDAIMFRSWEDHPEEFGLQLGIRGRLSYNVFKYMDTTVYGGVTGSCLTKIGIKSWKDLVPGFAMEGLAYQDTTHNSWYLGAVKAVSDAGIMTGLSENNFGASENLGRGQFATTLYRMEGQPEQGFSDRFSDVQDGYFYSLPVSWGSETGIITGYGHNDLFGTTDNITREQMATLMFRYAQYQGRDTSGRADLSGYGDCGNVSKFAGEAMQWIVNEGIIKGEGNTGLLNPQGNVSRAVCATIIQRYMGL